MNKQELYDAIVARPEISFVAPVAAWTKAWRDDQVPPNLSELGVTDWQYRKQYLNSADYIVHAVSKSTDGRVKKISINVSVADEGQATEDARLVEKDLDQIDKPPAKTDTSYVNAVQAYIDSLSPKRLLLFEIQNVNANVGYAGIRGLFDENGSGVWRTFTVYG